jgi:hypothetical protein
VLGYTITPKFTGILFPVFALLLLGTAVHHADVGQVHVAYMTGHELSEAGNKEAVGFVARLVEAHVSDSGKRALVLDTLDGYQVSAMVTDDVPAMPLTPGRRYAVQATTSRPGSVTISRVDGLKPMNTLSQTQASASVFHGQAYIQTALGTARIPTQLPDGAYEGVVNATAHRSVFAQVQED